MKGTDTENDKKLRLDQLRKFGLNTCSYLTLNNDLEHFNVPDIDGYVSYHSLYKTSIVVGDPICRRSDLGDLLDGFKKYSRDHRRSICIFMAKRDYQNIYEKAGFGRLYIGSEAVIDLETFTLSGNKMQNVRRGINHARRENIKIFEFDEYKNETGKTSREVYQSNLEVTKDWLGDKDTPELSFFISKLNERPPIDTRYFMAVSNRGTEAFAVCTPVFASNSYYIDLIRRRADAPNGTTELLIAEIFDRLKKDKARSVYIGFVPLSNIEAGNGVNNPIQNKIMVWLYNDMFNYLYPAKSSYFYKNKFRPRWEELFLYYYPSLSMKMIYAIFKSFLPYGIRGVIRHKLRSEK
jgi:phosphatidylglycerol lysyltransferase